MSSSHRDTLAMMKKPSFENGKALDQGIEMAPPKLGFWRRFANLMDVDILKDKIYLNILFGLSIFYVAEMNFKMVTPFFFANLGYSKADVAYCLSMTAITDIAARVVLPPICDRFNIRKRLIFFISIFFVAITRSSECKKRYNIGSSNHPNGINFFLFLSYGRTNGLDQSNDLAINMWLFPWRCFGKFYIDCVWILFPREITSRFRLAYGRQSCFCCYVCTIDR